MVVPFNGDVHASHLQLLVAGLPVLPLVEDGVHAYGGLAGLAVTDDQLTLPAANRSHRVDGLDAGLQGLLDALALHDRRGLNFKCAAFLGVDVAAAVDRLPERVDHAAEERVADGHRQHRAGSLDLLALFDVLEVTEDHGADIMLVEVQRDTENAAGKLQQFLRHHRGQSLDVGDTVASIDDGADLFARGVGLEAGDIFFDCALDLVG
jgi:hypothetical protein